MACLASSRKEQVATTSTRDPHDAIVYYVARGSELPAPKLRHDDIRNRNLPSCRVGVAPSLVQVWRVHAACDEMPLGPVLDRPHMRGSNLPAWRIVSVPVSMVTGSSCAVD